jgi:DNA modification methylase
MTYVVKNINISELHNAEWNANSVAPEVMQKVRKSISEFGVVENLVARPHPSGSGFEVVSGNHRLQIFRELGMEKAPVIIVDVDDAKARILAQTLNRTRGQDDPEKYAQLLDDVLKDMSVDEVLGFLPETAESIGRLLSGIESGAELPDEDEDSFEVPEDPESVPGEVYELGPHRLICGDSRDVTVLERVTNGEKAACVWTDPPYGVAIVGGNHSLSPAERKRRGGKTIENDALDVNGLREFLRETLGAAFTCTEPGAAWYVCAPHGPIGLAFSDVMTELGVWKHSLVWVKDSLVMGRADYHYRHEPIYYGWTPGGSHNWYSDRKQTTVIEIPRPKRNTEHPTMKPLELISQMLRNSTKRGDLVLDPFGGSGSTLMAADALGRRAALVELDPRYCDVIRKRYERSKENA